AAFGCRGRAASWRADRKLSPAVRDRDQSASRSDVGLGELSGDVLRGLDRLGDKGRSSVWIMQIRVNHEQCLRQAGEVKAAFRLDCPEGSRIRELAELRAGNVAHALQHRLTGTHEMYVVDFPASGFNDRAKLGDELGINRGLRIEREDEALPCFCSFSERRQPDGCPHPVESRGAKIEKALRSVNRK